MDPLSGNYSPRLYAVLRIVAGLLFLIHGAQKLFGYPPAGGDPVMLLSLFGLAGVIEFVAGLLIATGFLTRYAALVASGEMAFAYFIAHANRGLWPIENGGELAVLYCFLFLFMAAMGAGIWSVDAARRSQTAVMR